jgi:hypothetical protein
MYNAGALQAQEPDQYMTKSRREQTTHGLSQKAFVSVNQWLLPKHNKNPAPHTLS